MFRIDDKITFKSKEYTIKNFLGQGGMGQVFLIENNQNQQLALKSLTHYLPDDSNHRSLINEWEKAQQIKHKNVIEYIGFDDADSQSYNPYLVMELANGGTLEDFLKEQTELLTENECLSIFHQIINGMEAVNEILIHRDIKPPNIFIHDSEIKIADFGLAKIVEDKTRSKTFKGWGTEPYIAPEARRLETNTIQMDMYAIGHVFYQIATLKHAFHGSTNWELDHATKNALPINQLNQNISAKISSVINRLISKKPKDRYATWDDVRKDLERAVIDTEDNKSAIDSILARKLSRDNLKQKEESEKLAVLTEKKRVSDIINYSFQNSIINPIERFINDFNNVQGDNSMRLSQRQNKCTINFDNNQISIWFSQIEDLDYTKYETTNMWDERVTKTAKPELNNKKIIGWGAIENNNNLGMNIILVSSDEDEYGDWYILENEVNPISSITRRQSPFAFTRQELKKEIYSVNAFSNYQNKVEPLTVKKLKDFITISL